jgi:amidophosphoribosyltransferase
VVKGLGLVTEVFDGATIDAQRGALAAGHVRYSTTGDVTAANAQPIARTTPSGGFALAHNGNLVNTRQLASSTGLAYDPSASDSDVVATLLAQALSADSDLEQALGSVLPLLQGAFSLVLVDERRVYGVRDPNGLRPLCLGRLDRSGPRGAGWVLASETAALDMVGAVFVRDVEPGEVVVIDATGVRSLHPFAPARVDPKLCLFEFVYFARPDSRLYGSSVYSARRRAGEALAREAPLPVDHAGPPRDVLVMPVPDSACAAAEGFARSSGLPFGQGLVRNRYVGRTFLAQTQELRESRVRVKLNAIPDSVAGKRLVVVDDSVVRGTTIRATMRLLREAGAAEVHLRVASPPYRWPCFFGMATAEPRELLAASMSEQEMCEHLGCDSLAYLSLDALLAATGAPQAGFCTACLTGDYPVAVPGRVGREVFGMSA